MSEKNTISSLNEQLQKTQEDNLKLVSEIDDLLVAAKGSDASRPSEESLALVESEWTKKLVAKDCEIKDLQARIMNLEERNSQRSASPPAGDTGDTLVNGLQNMVKQLQQDVEELEADTIRLTDENSELHAKLELSSLELSEKSKLIGDLKASGSTSHPSAPDNLLKQLQQDVEELEIETNRLTDENSKLRAQLESSSLELSGNNRLTTEVKASESGEEHAQLLGKVVSLEGELNQLKEDTTRILSAKEEAEKSIQRLQTENQELQKSIRSLENSRPESFGRVQEREVANNQLFQQLAETVTGLEEELQESQEESRLSRCMQLHFIFVFHS